MTETPTEAFTDLENQVNGDAPETWDREAPSQRDIFVRATYGGGDPTLNRVREVSITIPVLGINDDMSEYEQIVRVTFSELAKLGNLASYEAARAS